MWMRNTYIPLDMVFIRADGTVHRIEARTEPMSETHHRLRTGRCRRCWSSPAAPPSGSASSPATGCAHPLFGAGQP